MQMHPSGYAQNCFPDHVLRLPFFGAIGIFELFATVAATKRDLVLPTWLAELISEFRDFGPRIWVRWYGTWISSLWRAAVTKVAKRL